MATVVETPRAAPRLAGPALWQRVLFRFACAYFVLYYLPSWAPRTTLLGVHAVVEWVAAHIFHLTGPRAVYPAVNGSGDTTLDYIHNLVVLVAAAAIAIVWAIFDRGTSDRRLYAWLRIWVRYSLAAILFSYGFAKVFPLQFTPPGFYKLFEPLKDFSPMGLLWTFMGFSPAYTIFAGAAEVTGATLLLFRRTTTLGALVSAGVMLNVVMLNFCYDVPVKLFSSNLLIAAIFLAAPDVPRLAGVLVLNRPSRPQHLDDVLFRTRFGRIVSISLKTLFIGFVFITHVWSGVRSYRSYYGRVKPPLYGAWRVDESTVNGKPMPPEERWALLLVDYPQGATVRFADDSSRFYPTRYEGDRVTFGSALKFTFTRPDEAHAVLRGEAGTLRLERIAPSQILLNNRGFHWINERPFNR